MGGSKLAGAARAADDATPSSKLANGADPPNYKSKPAAGETPDAPPKAPECEAGPHCFPTGTLIRTETGLRPIETIQAEDRVWAFDHVRAEWTLRRVLKTFAHPVTSVLTHIHLPGEVVRSTRLHPFWVCDGADLAARPRREHLFDPPPGSRVAGRWVDATDLQPGDTLLCGDGTTTTIEGIEHHPAELLIYNFGVDELHCYAVGASAVLVHNMCGPDNNPLDDVAPDRIQTQIGYRVVEDAELKDLIARGRFRSPPTGDTPTGQLGKWFYTTEAEAMDTARAWHKISGVRLTLVKAEIPLDSITFLQRNIDNTPTMPLGKTGFFSEFGKGLENVEPMF